MVKLDREKCIGCGLCVSLYPKIFDMEDFKAIIIKGKEKEEVKLDCPVDAIK